MWCSWFSRGSTRQRAGSFRGLAVPGGGARLLAGCGRIERPPVALPCPPASLLAERVCDGRPPGPPRKAARFPPLAARVVGPGRPPSLPVRAHPPARLRVTIGSQAGTRAPTTEFDTEVAQPGSRLFGPRGSRAGPDPKARLPSRASVVAVWDPRPDAARRHQTRRRPPAAPTSRWAVSGPRRGPAKIALPRSATGPPPGADCSPRIRTGRRDPGRRHAGRHACARGASRKRRPDSAAAGIRQVAPTVTFVLRP